jgi:hypothetical protein
MKKNESLEKKLRQSVEAALRDVLRKEDPGMAELRTKLRSATASIAQLKRENKQLLSKMARYEMKVARDVWSDEDFLERVIEEMIFNGKFPLLDEIIKKKKRQWSAAVQDFSRSE